MENKLKIRVKTLAGTQEIEVAFAENLREALLRGGFTPYQGKNKLLNCKGMGICGTCKVFVLNNLEREEKRSCQIQCFKPMEIELQ